MNIDFEKAIFIKNDDNTYMVMQSIDDNRILKLPRVSISAEVNVLEDKTTGKLMEMIELKKHNKTAVLLSKLFQSIKEVFVKAKRSVPPAPSEKVKDITKCTMCGKEFDMWDRQENYCFEHKIGYGSKYDGDTLKFNLCCDCFDKVVDTVIPMCVESPLHEV